jgi:hypothetical protein
MSADHWQSEVQFLPQNGGRKPQKDWLHLADFVN